MANYCTTMTSSKIGKTRWLAGFNKSGSSLNTVLLILELALMVPGIPSVSVRLVGGPTNYSGRVEVKVGQTWGTVCHRRWDRADASVVCRELGYPLGGKAVMNAAFGEGYSSQSILMAYVMCRGDEASLIDCENSAAYSCEHNEDAGVVCVTDARMASNGQTRLVDGNTNTSGRVEVSFNGIWGTVCRDTWTITNSRMVCKDQDLCGGNSVKHGEGAFGEGEGPVWLTDVNCTGKERTFSECHHPGWGENSCEHHSDVGVVCEYCPTGSMRLVGSDDDMSGFVSISNNGVWGTVCGCDEGFPWTDNEARVVCRALGYPDGVAVDTSNFTDVDGGPIWLSEVRCTGWEESLLDCQHDGSRGWGENNCRHYQDVGVRCTTQVLYTTPEPTIEDTTTIPLQATTQKLSDDDRTHKLIIIIVSIVVGAAIVVGVVVAIVCGVTKVKKAQAETNVMFTRRVETNEYMISADVAGAEGGACAEPCSSHGKLCRLDSGVYQEIEDKSGMPNSYDPRRFGPGKTPQNRNTTVDRPLTARDGDNAEPLPAIPTLVVQLPERCDVTPRNSHLDVTDLRNSYTVKESDVTVPNSVGDVSDAEGAPAAAVTENLISDDHRPERHLENGVDYLTPLNVRQELV